MSGARCSRKGVLPISLVRYLEAIEEAGRCLRCDKRGVIDTRLAPILERLGIARDQFKQSLGRIEKRCRNYWRSPPLPLLVSGLNVAGFHHASLGKPAPDSIHEIAGAATDPAAGLPKPVG